MELLLVIDFYIELGLGVFVIVDGKFVLVGNLEWLKNY